ncbi:TetR/AcrR family transcriptional regulator [Rhodococcus sp. X156]|uniref:TetR/AcrR family transcriptional regulator n=1 Tax=Rhodococcus sp. X156 TaxID=2499145 RepID=UPI000FDC09A1|nr:TetR/AcrR family transcriptional regulator [Rhodococcus sp. X156]
MDSVREAAVEPGPKRPWRGQQPEQRQAERRAKLLEAGLQILGTEGAAAVTMRGVCREAELTERYFYESFRNREQLLVAVLDMVALRARDAVLQTLSAGASNRAELIRELVRVFTRYVRDDPRRARVMFVESLAAPELIRRGAELVSEFTAPIAAVAASFGTERGRVDELDVELDALATFGAVAYLYQRWLRDGFTISTERMVEHVSLVVEQLAGVSSTGF